MKRVMLSVACALSVTGIFLTPMKASAFMGGGGLGSAIPVSDRALNDTVGGGLTAVSDNITNLGTQIDRTIAANTDEIVYQLKGVPLTALKYQSAQDNEVAPIVRGRCVNAAVATRGPNRDRALRQKEKENLALGRRIRDQRDAPAEAVNLASDIAVELAIRSSERSDEDPALLSGFGQDLTPEEVSLLFRKWDFMMMPVKEGLPTALREGELDTTPGQNAVFAAIQARNERLEAAGQVGSKVLARQATKINFDEVSELFPDVPRPESGQVSLEEFGRMRAHYRHQSLDWVRCIETDCSEKQLSQELVFMGANQLELMHRIASGIDQQNMILSLVLASLEESRVMAVKQQNDFDAGM